MKMLVIILLFLTINVLPNNPVRKIPDRQIDTTEVYIPRWIYIEGYDSVKVNDNHTISKEENALLELLMVAISVAATVLYYETK